MQILQHRAQGRANEATLFCVTFEVLTISAPNSAQINVISFLALRRRKVPLNRVPTGQRKLEKVREFEWSRKVRKRSWKNIFWKCQGKVRENEKLVPPDVRFLG